MPEDIFVLDIGTRTVMALLATLEDDQLVVSNLLYREHKTRSMLDGQIHDIAQVAKVIEELVQELKEQSGQDLKKVAVAAAGRSLKTKKGTARINYPSITAISQDDLLAVELQAVQAARQDLPKGTGNTPLSQQYYCVGYSIVEERLDGIRIGSVVGQKGQTVEVDVLATFLPRIVVDSLQSAVESAGLELVSITLEPIAVANVVLNQTMRRLNLVLVDIGAGTSDIAVCGGNTVSAFGMVPMAGDEITDALSDHYILDFNYAEIAKRQLSEKEEIITTDVLGFEQIIRSFEVKEIIEPATEALSTAIAQEVLELNVKAPQAVLLVGGGSLTPGLSGKIAQLLNLPANRVAVQQAGMLPNVSGLPEGYSGPNFITVLGIAYTALHNPTLGFMEVNVNEKPVHILNLGENRVSDALLASGFNIREVIGRPGMALTCEINDQIYTIPGKMGTRGKIILNSQPADLQDVIHEGDTIVFEPGIQGEDAHGTFGEILRELIGNCTVNGKAVDLNPSIKVDGVKVDLNEEIQDGCRAQVITNLSINEVLAKVGLSLAEQAIYLNGNRVSLAARLNLKLNGIEATLRDLVSPGDHIICQAAEDLTIGDFLPIEDDPSFELVINGHKAILNQTQIQINNIPAQRSTPVKAGDYITYEPGKRNFRPILIDVFNEIKFSPNPPAGKNKLLLKVNGEDKEYTYLLQEGDNVEVTWI